MENLLVAKNSNQPFSLRLVQDSDKENLDSTTNDDEGRNPKTKPAESFFKVIRRTQRRQLVIHHLDDLERRDDLQRPSRVDIQSTSNQFASPTQRSEDRKRFLSSFMENEAFGHQILKVNLPKEGCLEAAQKGEGSPQKKVEVLVKKLTRTILFGRHQTVNIADNSVVASPKMRMEKRTNLASILSGYGTDDIDKDSPCKHAKLEWSVHSRSRNPSGVKRSSAGNSSGILVNNLIQLSESTGPSMSPSPKRVFRCSSPSRQSFSRRSPSQHRNAHGVIRVGRILEPAQQLRLSDVACSQTTTPSGASSIGMVRIRQHSLVSGYHTCEESAYAHSDNSKAGTPVGTERLAGIRRRTLGTKKSVSFSPKVAVLYI